MRSSLPVCFLLSIFLLGNATIALQPINFSAGAEQTGDSASKFEVDFYPKVLGLLESEESRDYSVIFIVKKASTDNKDAKQVAKENKDRLAIDLKNSHNAKNIVKGTSLSFVIAQVPIREILKLAKYDHVLLIGDGEREGKFAMNTARPTVSAENLSVNGSGVRIAIIDTGMNLTHPDYASRIVAQANCNPVGCDVSGTTSDWLNHGTHVVGIAAGSGSLDQTRKGIASGASIINIRNDDPPQSAEAIHSLQFALDNGADVVNLSITYGTCLGDPPDAMDLAFDEGVDEGLVIVHAAGNEGYINGQVVWGSNQYPCGFNLLNVGNFFDNDTSTLSDDAIWNTSSRGPTSDGRMSPEIAAPGSNISSPDVCFNYAHLSYFVSPPEPGYCNYPNQQFPIVGTSYSAPMVAGAAAVLLEAHPGYTPLQVKGALLLGATWMVNSSVNMTARDFENGIQNTTLNTWGFGKLNVTKSLALANSGQNIVRDEIGQGEIKQYNFTVTQGSQVKDILSWLKHPTGTVVNPGDVTVSDLNFEIKNAGGTTLMNSSSQYQNNEFAVFSAPVTGEFTITVSASSVYPSGSKETFVLASTHSLTPVIDGGGGGEGSGVRSYSVTLGTPTTTLKEIRVLRTNSASGASCPSGSYWDSYPIEVSVDGRSSSYCRRISFEYDTTSIPEGATVTRVTLKFEVTSVINPRNCAFTPIALTTLYPGASAASVWADIGDGTPYVSSSSACTTVGIKSVELGSAANADLMVKQPSNWFAVGVKYSNETRDSIQHKTRVALGFVDGGIHPVLVVDYTMPSDSQVYATVYQDSSNSTYSGMPRFREWNPSQLTWSDEVRLPDTGSEIRATWVAYNPVASNRIAVMTLSTDGTLNFFRCNGSCTAWSNWELVSADFADVIAGTGNVGTQAATFAGMAFEQLSGDLLIVYDKDLTEPNDIYYRTYSMSGTFGSETGYNITGGTSSDSEKVCCIVMKSKPNSDEITIALATTKGWGIIWNGNQLTNLKEVSSSIAGGTRFDIAAAYETNSGASMIFAGVASGQSNASYARWDGSSWSQVGYTDYNPTAGGIAYQFRIASDPLPSSNKLMVCAGDSVFDLNCAQVNSGVVGSWNTMTTGLTSVSRGFDFVYDPGGTTGGVVYHPEGTAQRIYWKLWNGTGFSTASYIFRNDAPIGSDVVYISGLPSRYLADSFHGMFLLQEQQGVGALWYDGNGIGWFGLRSISLDTSDTYRENMAIAAKPN